MGMASTHCRNLVALAAALLIPLPLLMSPPIAAAPAADTRTSAGPFAGAAEVDYSGVIATMR